MNWQQRILAKPEFQLQKLLLVADPDEILHEPTIRQGLLDKDWEIIEYRDPVVFRLMYEKKYRNLRDIRVLVCTDAADFDVFPYDIWKSGHRLKLSMQNLFPKLDYGVIKQLGSELLPKLYSEYQRFDGDQLGEQGTKDLILEKVYGLYPRIVHSYTDLFSVLLKFHYSGQALPSVLSKRFLDELSFDACDISVLKYVDSREDFFQFLQEEWQKYVNEEECIVPFDHEAIRIYIDSLFLEGMLQPVQNGKASLPSWAKVGVVKAGASREQLGTVLAKLMEAIEAAETQLHWQKVGRLLAEAIFLTHKLGLPTSELGNLRSGVEAKFFSWLHGNYGGLQNLSYYNGPVMVHHVPWFLALQRRKGAEKVALLVMDGMAMDQWLVIKEGIQAFDGLMTESSSFAWIPTTTAISRQAMFAGEMPMNIADYLTNTSREDNLWQLFWSNQHLDKQAVYYAKSLGQGKAEDDFEHLTDHRIKVAGLIVDTVDKLAHGEILGGKGLHERLRVWLQEGYLLDLINRLTDSGFHVYITSDHGNVAAVGKGSPREGVLVEDAGERVRIYTSQEFQEQGKQRVEAVQWPAIGLPNEMHVLLAKGKTAFVQEGKTVIGHGGASISEVIVPFIHLWKEDRQ